MDNYKAENQEQEIDLVSLFFAVAHRYKQMAAAAVICAVLFGALGSVKEMLNQRAIGEAIAIVLGLMRSNVWLTGGSMLAGKTLRYIVVLATFQGAASLL